MVWLSDCHNKYQCAQNVLLAGYAGEAASRIWQQRHQYSFSLERARMPRKQVCKV
jgi:hypothetical protein